MLVQNGARCLQKEREISQNKHTFASVALLESHNNTSKHKVHDNHHNFRRKEFSFTSQ